MTLLENAKLISFRICPFVVRSQIVAKENGITLDTIYIDLENKPKWFLDQSPTGTVPALLLNDVFIFESTVIVDFIDALAPQSLYPDDLAEKYQNKSWIEYASTVIGLQYMAMTAKDKESYDEAEKAFLSALSRLNELKITGPFFNGGQFSIIDAAYAPVLYRLLLFKTLLSDKTIDMFPCLASWAESVVDRESVKFYLNDEFNGALIEHMKSAQSYLGAMGK